MNVTSAINLCKPQSIAHAATPTAIVSRALAVGTAAHSVVRILLLLTCLLVGGRTASGDTPGGPIYHHDASNLFRIDNPLNVAASQVFVGNIPGAGNGGMADIAFSLGTADLYGVAFVSGGSFWSINKNTANAQQLSTTYSGFDIPTFVNALASFAPGQFYAATASTGQFFNWTWNGSSLTGASVGNYHDVNSEPGFGGATSFVSAGDIWVDPNGDVYATVNRPGFTGGWLVRVDPTTAEIDHLWTFTGSGSETHFGLARSGGLLYVLRDFDGSLFAWNGSTLINTGQVSAFGVGGATATNIIPEPTTMALIGATLLVCGLLARRRRPLAA
jgi:hypothetical protein